MKHIGITILISNDTIWLVRALGIFLLISFIIFAYILYYKHKASESKQLSEYLYNDTKDISMHDLDENHEETTNQNELTKLKSDNNETDGISFDVNNWQKRLILMGLGVTSGLIRGLWGIAGVPIMFFALITNINFNEFRSSAAFAIILSEIVSIIQLYIIEDKMDIDNKWIEYISILVGGFIGVLVGNYLAKYHLSQEGFHWFIMYIMFTGGIVLCLKDIWTALFDIIITSTLLILPFLALIGYWIWRLTCKSVEVPDKTTISTISDA